jgi:hypothetical protein
MRLRDAEGGAKFEVGPVEFEMAEDEGNLILKISKWGLIAGDELRLELKILDGDYAG